MIDFVTPEMVSGTDFNAHISLQIEVRVSFNWHFLLENSYFHTFPDGASELLNIRGVRKATANLEWSTH
ncbi:hypothetical protein [Aeromonas salmonicida]|uniref:hypothetical protein n=1 Tax=Aeromonas salmonicida TaxID=645 RepID=UPI0027B92FF7|nr:hypothetical protein [Aeromonas salmonicida]